MNVKRHGQIKFQGECQIEFPAPTFTWDKLDSTLLIRQENVKDFNSETKHKYELRITTHELNQTSEYSCCGSPEQPSVL